LRPSGSKQHHLGLQRQDLVQVGRQEVGETVRLPLRDQGVGSHDAARRETLVTNTDFLRRIAADQIDPRARRALGRAAFECEFHVTYDTAHMREIAVVLSDLYLPRSADAPSVAVPAALPGLEEAARFGQKRRIDGGWRAWLARWMGRDDLARAAPAAVAAAVSPRASGEGSVWMANPLHLIAGLTNVHLDYRGLLRLPAQDLASLAQDFTKTFGEAEFHLEPLASGPFLLRSSRSLNVTTTEPSRVLAHELEPSLPNGPDAPVLKRLGAELEMWLHGHPVNEGRRSRGELSVSTLWCWGGGAALLRPESTVSPPGSATRAAPTAGTPSAGTLTTPPLAFGSDPYLVGLSHLTGLPLQSLPERLPDPTDWSHSQRVVLVAELTASLHANPGWTMFEALAHLDRCFILPAIESLRTGAVDSVLVIANDIRLHVARRDRLRFWRRRPTSGSAALRVMME
jgi:hypothetical protein